MVYVKDDIEQIDDQQVEALIAQLPDWRRTIALRYKFTAGRRECALAYLLLCQGLRQEYGITDQPHFVEGEHGKPSLQEHPTIHFNMSHCKQAVVCAVSNEPVGVDIECYRKINDSLIQHCMNADEIAQINSSSDPQMQFLKFWTAKEAVVKLSGEGLACNIPDILIDAERKHIRIETHVNAEKGYAYSMATYQEK